MTIGGLTGFATSAVLAGIGAGWEGLGNSQVASNLTPGCYEEVWKGRSDLWWVKIYCFINNIGNGGTNAAIISSTGGTMISEGSSSALASLSTQAVQELNMNLFPRATTNAIPWDIDEVTIYGQQPQTVIDNPRISQNYSASHPAVDVTNSDGNTYGQNIRALQSGTVVRNVTQPDGDAGGARTRIQTNSGYSYMYCHMIPGSNAYIHVGDQVNAGDIIGKLGGKIGESGKSTGPHLHIEIWPHQDPLHLFPNLQILR